MKGCNDCGALFETCKVIKEPHYEVDTRIYEEISVCPECGSDDWIDVKLCSWCEERYYDDSIQDYCDDCYADVSSMANQLAYTGNKSFAEAKDLIGSWLER